ncbi:MAG: adenine phosphoribosyltransferase [Anaerolineae bacterium]|nr:adenine phosphoribosyltransferase [Anaerolineae bacterium]
MSQEREIYPVEVAGLQRALPLFEVAPGVRIAIVNILGDTELVQVSARALAEALRAHQPSALVTAEAKAIPLAYALSVEMGVPFVVLRKTYKSYMGEALSSETASITTGKTQTLYLDEKDRAIVSGHSVVLVDDVISTGSTLNGMRLLMEQAAAKVVATAAIFTEGDGAQWKDVIALGHLPVFTNKQEDDDL